MSLKMFVENCPKTRNQEFGDFLECLTEKYCDTVMKLDKLILEFDHLKEKNDAVINFQKENLHKHDSEIEKIKNIEKEMKIRQETNLTKCLEIVEEKVIKLSEALEQKESKLKLKKAEDRIKMDIFEQIVQIKPMIEENSENINTIFQNLKVKENNIEKLSTQLDEVLKESDSPSETITHQMEDKLNNIFEELENKACKSSLTKMHEQNTGIIDKIKDDFDRNIRYVESNYLALNKKQISTNSKLEDHAIDIKDIKVLAEQ